MTLPEFLAARYDEEADVDWHVFDCSGMPHGPEMTEPCCDAQARLLADIEAKRKVLAEYEAQRDYDRQPGDTRTMEERRRDDAAKAALGQVLALLAEPFSSHPDYRAEFRP